MYCLILNLSHTLETKKLSFAVRHHHVHIIVGTSASFVPNPIAGCRCSRYRNRSGRSTRWPLTFVSRRRASVGHVLWRGSIFCWWRRSWKLWILSDGMQLNTCNQWLVVNYNINGCNHHHHHCIMAVFQGSIFLFKI